ncbi:efflux transporter outer membrane subunit [Orrella sp. 11846]|uniref:efflux transporter outer membrane subunit n=1 Tax=Orrella sp. 11846 TaxID=3409913 RepID=UPI003B592196
MAKWISTKGFALSAMAVLLAGCNFAPTYEAPSTTMPAAYGEQTLLRYDSRTGKLTEETVKVDALESSDAVNALTPWQDFFKDETLKSLIALALKDNRNMQVAVARMEQAEAMWGGQRGALFPQLGASVQGSRQQIPNPTGQGTQITSQYNAGVGLTAFEIDLFGRLRNLSDAAYERYLSSAQGVRSVQIALVADTAIHYYRERMAWTLLELARQTFEARKKNYNLVSARYRSGVASELDLSQAKGLVDAAAAQMAQLTREQVQAQNALAILIGQPIPDNLKQKQPISLKDQVARIPTGLPSELLTRRPDILAAENTLRAAGANIGAARAAFLPSINLTGALGVVSTALGDLFTAGVFGWTVAPALSVPLFTGGTLSANLDQATAAQREAVASYQGSVEQAFREVSDVLAGETTLQAQWDALNGQTQAAKRSVNLSQARFANGVDSFLAVQNAQINHYNALTQQVQTTFELLSNRVNLYKALGGGWDESQPGAARREAGSSTTPVVTRITSPS